MIILNNECFYPTRYEGYYVSKSGIIISFRVRGGGVNLKSNPTFLSYKKDKYGYYQVLFSVDSKRTYKAVHQVVMETFVGDTPAGHQIDHKDNKKENNSIDNLQFLTIKENVRKARKGLKPKIAKNVTLTLDGNTKEFFSIKDAMRSIGCSPSAYYRMRDGTISARFRFKVMLFNEGVETTEIILETNKIVG